MTLTEAHDALTRHAMFKNDRLQEYIFHDDQFDTPTTACVSAYSVTLTSKTCDSLPFYNSGNDRTITMTEACNRLAAEKGWEEVK